MHKSDLKNGMIVELRGINSCGVIMNGQLQCKFDDINCWDFLNLNYYDSDLKSIDRQQSKLDMVKIYEVKSLFSFGDGKDLNYLELVWERNEEWENVSVGTRVMVKTDFNDEYQEAIFLDVNNDKHFLTYDKRKGIQHWNYCKLKEEEKITDYELIKEYHKYINKSKRNDSVYRWLLDNYEIKKKQ